MPLKFNRGNARVLDDLLEGNYSSLGARSSFGSCDDDEEGFHVTFSGNSGSIDLCITLRGEGIYIEGPPEYKGTAEGTPFEEHSPGITGSPESLRKVYAFLKDLPPGSTATDIMDTARGSGLVAVISDEDVAGDLEKIEVDINSGRKQYLIDVEGNCDDDDHVILIWADSEEQALEKALLNYAKSYDIPGTVDISEQAFLRFVKDNMTRRPPEFGVFVKLNPDTETYFEAAAVSSRRNLDDELLAEYHRLTDMGTVKLSMVSRRYMESSGYSDFRRSLH